MRARRFSPSTRSRPRRGHRTRPARSDEPTIPRGAKKMLADAGVTDLSMKLWWMPVARPYNPNGKRMGELIQADWSAIGVNVELVSMDWPVYLEQSSAVDRDGAVMIGWGADNADPDNFLGVLLGCAARRHQQPCPVVQRALRRSDPEGQGDVRPGRAHHALLSRPRRSSTSRRRGCFSPTRTSSSRTTSAS